MPAAIRGVPTNQESVWPALVQQVQPGLDGSIDKSLFSRLHTGRLGKAWGSETLAGHGEARSGRVPMEDRRGVGGRGRGVLGGRGIRGWNGTALGPPWRLWDLRRSSSFLLVLWRWGRLLHHYDIIISN